MITLSPEDEKTRAMLFPDLTPEQFVDFIRQRRDWFASLPADAQDRVRACVDRIGQQTAHLKDSPPQ